MNNIINTKIDRPEETNHQILTVLSLIRSELHIFKTETEEKFEFIIEHVATKTELSDALANTEQKLMSALNRKTSDMSDRFDAKLSELKRDIVHAVRNTDKRFLKFAI